MVWYYNIVHVIIFVHQYLHFTFDIRETSLLPTWPLSRSIGGEANMWCLIVSAASSRSCWSWYGPCIRCRRVPYQTNNNALIPAAVLVGVADVSAIIQLHTANQLHGGSLLTRRLGVRVCRHLHVAASCRVQCAALQLSGMAQQYNLLPRSVRTCEIRDKCWYGVNVCTVLWFMYVCMYRGMCACTDF